MKSRTYKRAPVVSPAREGMRVPVLRKLVTVLLDFAHKQEPKHPDMFGIHSIEFVVPFKSSKQTPPQAHKVTACFHP